MAAISFAAGVCLGHLTRIGAFVPSLIGGACLIVLCRGRWTAVSFLGALLSAGALASARAPPKTVPTAVAGRVVEVERGDADTRFIVAGRGGARIRLHVSGQRPDVGVGDLVATDVPVRGLRGFANPEIGDSSERSRARGEVAAASVSDPARIIVAGGTNAGPRGLIERARDRVRSEIDLHLGEPARGVMRALVLGEGGSLTEQAADAYRKSGTMHVLAVSGLHLVFVAAGLDALLAFVLIRIRKLAASIDVRRPAALIAIPLVSAYAVFAGGQPSAVRATLTACAYLSARALGRASVSSAAMAVAVMAQLAWWPERVSDPGLQLSYAAVLALLLVAPVLQRAMERRRPMELMEQRGGWRERLRHAVLALTATNIAASAVTAPIVAHHFGQVTPAGLVANFVAVPVSGFVLLPAGLAAAVAVVACPPLVGPLLHLAGLVCDLLTDCLGMLARLPGASFEVPRLHGVLAVALVGALLLIPLCRRWLRIALLSGIVLAAIGPGLSVALRRSFGDELVLTILDVGQGDASVLELPFGGALLVDGGGFVASPLDPGRVVVRPYLAARGIRSLDAVVLSHPHPDHLGGLAAAVRGLGVRAFWDNGQGAAERLRGGYPRLLGALLRRGVRVRGPPQLCSQPWRRASVSIEVLAPCPDVSFDLGLNDNSLVLRVTHGRVRILLAGDIEAEGEGQLLAKVGDLRSDLVKVPHHGSRTSSGAALVSRTRPRFAVISVGARNHFGHPADEVAARWRASGATVLRTDISGGVRFVSDGRTIRLDATGRAQRR